MTCYSSEGDYLKFGLDDPFVVFLGGTAFFVCPLPSMFVPVSHGFQNNTLRTNVNTVHIAHSESEVLQWLLGELFVVNFGFGDMAASMRDDCMNVYMTVWTCTFIYWY